jgi:hypothetical protein
LWRADRERGRLGLDLVGAEAASFTSDFNLERRVRVGLGLAAISPPRLAAADSAVAGSGAASVFGLRPILCQRRSVLGIRGGRQGMILPQSAALQIFIRTQAVSASDVAA